MILENLDFNFYNKLVDLIKGKKNVSEFKIADKFTGILISVPSAMNNEPKFIFSGLAHDIIQYKLE